MVEHPLRGDCPERVALDLLTLITSTAQGLPKIDQPKTLETWLTWYAQCLQAVRGLALAPENA